VLNSYTQFVGNNNRAAWKVIFGLSFLLPSDKNFSRSTRLAGVLFTDADVRLHAHALQIIREGGGRGRGGCNFFSKYSRLLKNNAYHCTAFSQDILMYN
jgi:hypothetical protein